MTPLRAATHPLRRAAPVRRRVLVAGGAGVLGAALLEQLLAARHFAQVSVARHAAGAGGLARAVPVLWDASQPVSATPDHTAVVVFDRARVANGREEAFLKRDPTICRCWPSGCARVAWRHLLVVMPHAQPGLPDALSAAWRTR